MYWDGRGLAERQGLLGVVAGLRGHGEPAGFSAQGSALAEQGRQGVAEATVVDAEGFAQSLAPGVGAGFAKLSQRVRWHFQSRQPDAPPREGADGFGLRQDWTAKTAGWATVAGQRGAQG